MVINKSKKLVYTYHYYHRLKFENHLIRSVLLSRTPFVSSTNSRAAISMNEGTPAIVPLLGVLYELLHLVLVIFTGFAVGKRLTWNKDFESMGEQRKRRRVILAHGWAFLVPMMAIPLLCEMPIYTVALSNRKRLRPLRQRHDKLSVEKELQKRYNYIIGADESGRGCLAGPVVAASCCIVQDLDDYEVLPTVDDCKLISEKERRRIFDHIQQNPDIYEYSVEVIPASEIDGSNVEVVCQRALGNSVHQLAGRFPFLESVYAIIDGKKSPKTNVTCRPFVQGDAHVYSVALASIIARVSRDGMMMNLAKEYPQYQFEINGGYSTSSHKEAIHKYGPSPIHRLNHKPVKGHVGRAGFLSVAISSFLGASPTEAMYMDSKTGIRLPETGEIEKAIPVEWSQSDDPTGVVSGYSRLDNSDDALFYSEPRYVEHVDAQAVEIMTKYISSEISKPDTDSILDLCSSWTSHIRGDVSKKHLVGLGMNADELDRNPVLTRRIVQDLNKDPLLPFQDSSFDMVLCQLSIDYLTNPLTVCKEIGRILKRGGSVQILFSNRLFLSKAVALWTGADDLDHAFTVASYLHFCNGGFSSIEAKDLSVRKGGKIVGDPVYVVRAVRI